MDHEFSLNHAIVKISLQQDGMDNVVRWDDIIGCLSLEIGNATQLRSIDVSSNALVGKMEYANPAKKYNANFKFVLLRFE